MAFIQNAIIFVIMSLVLNTEIISADTNCTLDNKFDCTESVMVYIDRDYIRAFNFSERRSHDVSRYNDFAWGIAYDGSYVFWYDARMIHRSFLNGSNQEEIVKSSLGHVLDIQVDWYTNNIYFYDRNMKRFCVCSNDGFRCTVLKTDHDYPIGFVINPIKGEMYWTDFGAKIMIAKSNMDGSDFVPFVTDNIGRACGITLDYSDNRLYWADNKKDTIESVDIDGSNRKVIEVMFPPYYLSVFNDKLYWTTYYGKNLQEFDKLTGNDKKNIFTGRDIRGLKIYYPSMVIKKDHACKTNPCSHLCLLKGENSYTCTCPEGQQLSSDGKTCFGKKKDTYLVISAGDTILSLYHQHLSRDNIFKKTYLGKNFTQILHDGPNHRVIVYDAASSAIYNIENFDEENSELTKLADNIEMIVRMDHDYNANTLYWCDGHKGTLEVLSLATLHRSVIMNVVDGKTIIDFALLPERGLMFVALRSKDGNIEINSVSMDGRKTFNTIIETDITGPTVKILYAPGAHTLYIADIEAKIIDSIHIFGYRRQTFKRLEFEPTSLAILKRNIVLTKALSNNVYFIEMGDDRDITSQEIPMKDVKPIYLATVPERFVTAVGVNHTCGWSNDVCSHICIQRRPEPKNMTLRHTCLCPSDMIMTSDNKTCECKPDMFQCSSGQCISGLKMCDKNYDCQDKSDEINCQYYDALKSCKSGQYKCKSGLCVDNLRECLNIEEVLMECPQICSIKANIAKAPYTTTPTPIS